MSPSPSNTSAPASTNIEQQRRQGYEPNTLNVSFIWSVMIGLAVLVLIAMLLMALLFQRLAGRSQRSTELSTSLEQVRPLPVEPSLDASQRLALEEIRAAEQDVLSRYEWIDEQQGVARIPIERAMEIFVERGAPEISDAPASAAEAERPPETNDNDQS